MTGSDSQTGQSRQTWVALLGRRDKPVDGVEDYCAFLGRALVRQGVELRPVRVPWAEQGWLRALWGLWREAAGWRGQWVLLQHTALAWSRRGLPFGALAVLAVLRRRGVRCAVVFHEPQRQLSSGWIAQIRGACQDWVIHRLHRGAERAIFADPLANVPWLPKDDRKSAFIPIGANIPERLPQSGDFAAKNGAPKTVAVFCLDGMPHVRKELREISTAARLAAEAGARFRVTFLGRGTREARDEIGRAFQSVPVEVSNLGLLKADEVSDVLAESDAMVCVRGRLYPRRGSAIAGIACGLPVIGYAGAAEGTPLAEAGVQLVPYGDAEALGTALGRVLTQPGLADELRRKSARAQQSYFSWDLIARRVVESLGPARAEEDRGLNPSDTIASAARKRKMKVLIYGEYFLPIVGGVQTAMNLLARGLAELPAEKGANGTSGVEVTVATRTPANGMDDSGLRYGVVRQPSFWRLARLIRESDVIHVAGPCLVPMAIAWLMGKPAVVEHHGYQAGCPNGLLLTEPSKTVCSGHFAQRQYLKCLCCTAATMGWAGGVRSLLLSFPRRWLCKTVAANITISDHVGVRLKLPRSRTIYYGTPDVPPSRPTDTRPTRSVPSVAYVGRLSAEKGLPLLVQAAKLLRDQNISLTLVFIGDGPERGRLEASVGSMGLQATVEFTGDLRGEALERALDDVNVLVMPSICEETAGLSAIEQMMRGRVVVASDIGGLGEVVGDSGLKFAPGDARALACCIKSAIEGGSLTSELRAAARERAMRLFQVDNMVREHLSVYETLALRQQCWTGRGAASRA